MTRGMIRGEITEIDLVFTLRSAAVAKEKAFSVAALKA
jgi:hypothetical protein